MRQDRISPSPFGHLDCQENPYDLRPMVRQIMDAENWLLERRPPDRPLVIIMGEYHEAQAHMLLQKAVLMAHTQLRGISDAGNFAYGCELSHDYVFRYTGKIIDDPHGHEAVEVRRRFSIGAAYAAHQDLLDFCVDQNISVSFNDVSCSGERVDYRAAFTRAVVEKYSPSMLSQTPVNRAENRQGVAVSNICMVEGAMEHIDRTGAKVYIQQCGQAHVFGDLASRYPFEESLSIRFLERGAEILPVICNYEREQKYIPAEAEALFDQSVILSYNDMAPEGMPFQKVRNAIGFQSGLEL